MFAWIGRMPRGRTGQKEFGRSRNLHGPGMRLNIMLSAL